jgi:hypothetical protein
MNMQQLIDAFDANPNSETARAYFFGALAEWKIGNFDDYTLEYVAYECGPFLGGHDQ